MKGRTVSLVALVVLLCPHQHHCQAVTGQAVVETLYKTLNKTHRFTIRNSAEYYVKFTVPEKVIKRLETEKDKHIFQVKLKIARRPHCYHITEKRSIIVLRTEKFLWLNWFLAVE